MSRIIEKSSILGTTLLAAVLFTTIWCTPANADVVSDWNGRLQQALLTAKTSPIVASRVMAMVQVAVFDAVNGIDGRYTPIHARLHPRAGASRRAAAVQAAYATLVQLFPSQQETLDAQREASLASIASDSGVENSESIARGIEFGQAVADNIVQWRSTDGFTPAPPPYLGGSAAGQWRPTPPALLPGAGPQFASMTPWAMSTPSQFRPSPPPALTSDVYATDLQEVQEVGRKESTTRTADQTEIAVFWNGNTPAYWNRIALMAAEQRHLTMLAKARLLAVLNVAMGDAIISCWDAKYAYEFWRPITAIRLASSDGNAATQEDPSWTPVLVTPAFPEYPSGHATVSGAAAVVLGGFFGNEAQFTLESETLPGVVRAYDSFAQAADEANAARIFGGIHFRSACTAGRATGEQVGANALATTAQPIHDRGHRPVTPMDPGGEDGTDDQP